MKAPGDDGTRSTDLVQEEPLVDDTQRWSVLVIHSPDALALGVEVVLDRLLRIGRASGSRLDVSVSDHRMSRQHAEIAHTGAGFEIADLGSLNGTFVDAQRVSRSPLAVGSVIRVGDTLLSFDRCGDLDFQGDPEFVGCSAAHQQVVEHARKVAAATLPILILGETGVGKDALARRIHEMSGRSGPFVAVNCAAIPHDLTESSLFGHRRGAFTGAVEDNAGFFRSAANGTLFLDEIGALPLVQQPKLLRVLESRTFIPLGSTEPMATNARIIAATNADLHAETIVGSFREDLLARLAGFVIRVPPLRRCRRDIPVLVDHFLRALAPGRPIALTPSFLEGLLTYEWPLNVRELRLVVERLLLVHGDETQLRRTHLDGLLGFDRDGRTPSHLPAKGGTTPSRPTPPALRAPAPPAGALIERLTYYNGNIARVAKHYGKATKQVYRWLAAYGIDPTRFRPD